MAAKTWTGTSGDWDVGTLWSPTGAPGRDDTALFGGTDYYVATIGSTTTADESEAVAGVTLTDSAANLQITQGSTLATSGTIDLAAGNLSVGGLLSGGTLLGGAGVLEIAGGTLSHATLLGTVAVGTDTFGATLDISGGLTFLAEAGVPGILAFDGNDNQLALAASQVLTNGEILLGGYQNTLFDATVATLGSGFELAVAAFEGGTLAGSFVNQGTISLGEDASLAVTPSLLTNNGVIELASRSSIDVASATTSQIAGLARGLIDQGGFIVVAGTLDNRGATLNYATSPLAAELGLNGATVLGGTLAAGGDLGATLPSGATLSGVTVEGVFTLPQLLSVTGGLVLEGAAGSGPGSLVLGGGSTLSFLDSETLDNASVTAESYSDAIVGLAGGTLTLGSHLTVQVASGQMLFGSSSGSLVDNAVITVGSAAFAALDFAGAGFSGGGAISVANGGTLAIGGSLTVPELNAILGQVSGPGSVELDGTLINSGVFSEPRPVILDADIIGGTVVNSGSLTVAGGTLDGVTFQGPLVFSTNGYQTVTVKDGLSLTGGGTIDMAGYGDVLALADAESLPTGVLGMIGQDTLLASASVLTLGGGFTVNASGAGNSLRSAATIVNAGAINVTGSAAGLNIAVSTLVNDGLISVAAGDTLTIGATGQSLALSGSGSLALAAGSTLDLGGVVTTAQVQTLAAAYPGISIVLSGTVLNTGAVLATAATGTLTSLVLDGDIIGGTVVDGGGALLVGGGTLAGVTFDGPLNFGTLAFAAVTALGSLTLQDAAGGPGGTIVFDGLYQSLILNGITTLDNTVIDVNGPEEHIQAANYPGTLDFGPGVLINDADALTITASSIANAGTLLVAPAAVLDLGASTIVNSGVVSIAGGGELQVGQSSASLDLSNTGTFDFAAGSTLLVESSQTPGQLLALLGNQAGVTVELGGVLYNAGTSLVIGAGPLTEIIFSGVDIQGGVLIPGSGLTVSDAELDGVTVQGALTLGAGDAGGFLSISEGLTLENAAGSLGGTIYLAGANDEITILDLETLDHVTVIATGTPNQYSEPVQEIFSNYEPLDFGPDFTLEALGPALLSAVAVTNAGTLSATGAAGALFLDTPLITNTGIISAGSGDVLGIGVNQGGLALDASLTLGNSPFALDLASGATLELGDVASTGQLLGLLGAATGVAVALRSTLVNTGTSLAIGSSGGVTDLLLDGGSIAGGVIANRGGTLTVDGGTFDGVTFAGALDLSAGSDLAIAGGIQFTGATGSGPGTIDTTTGTSFYSPAGTLTFLDSETLANVVVDAVNAGLSLVADTPVLTIGTSATLNIGAALTVIADTILNGGTISGLGAALVALQSATIVNTGSVTIAAGGTLAIDAVPGYNGAFSGLGDPLALTGSGSISLGSNATLALGSTESTAELLALVGSVASTALQLDLVGTVLNAGTAITVGTTGLSDVLLDADILGGSIDDTGGALLVAGGTFQAVTFEGTLDLAAQSNLDLTGGLTLSGTGGSGIATIDPTGYSGTLTFLDTATLAEVFVNDVTGGFSLVADAPSLTLAASATVAVADAVSFVGGTIVNAGTIASTGTALVDFASGTIVNTGLISIAPGGTLALDAASPSVGLGGALDLVGSIAIGAGGTLVLGSSETTAQLLALLGSLSLTDETVELLGTLDNRGAVLTIGSSGPLSNVILDGDILGGAIVDAGGTLQVQGGTLDGVTVEGPLVLSGDADLAVKDGLALQGTAGGPGLVDVTGYVQLTILDATPLDGATVDESGGGYLTVTNTTGTLSLGSGLTIDSASGIVLEGSTIVSGAQINLTTGSFGIAPYYFPSAGGVSFQANTIFNSGAVNIPAGTGIGIDPTGTGPLDFVNTGPISIATGATLAIGGAETTAQVTALAGSLSHAGVTLVLGGVIANAGTALVLGTGVFGNVTLDGTIFDGTVINAGGTVGFERTQLQTVTFDGPLAVAKPDAYVDIVGPLTVLNTLGGTPGTLSLTGGNDALIFANTTTLDNLSVVTAGNERIEHGTLTLGQGVSIAVERGILTDQGTDLINQGSIAVSGGSYFRNLYIYQTGLLLSSQTVVNAGIITIGSGDIFGITLAPSIGPSLPFTNTGTGSVTLAAGAALEIGGTVTNGQLMALLGSLSNPGVAVELTGSVFNQAAVLSPTAGSVLSDLELDADVIGGTLASGTGQLLIGGGTLDGVTSQGTLVLNDAFSLNILDGLTLQGAAGGAGAIDFVEERTQLVFADNNETLANATVALAAFDDSLSFQTLTLAANLQTTVQSVASLVGDLLVNDGTLSELGASTVLEIATGSIVNNGVINVGAGDRLDLEPGLYVTSSPINVSGTGVSNFAAGSTLEIGGLNQTPQLVPLIASIIGSQTGVVIDLHGKIVNTGTTLDFATTGPLSDVVLNAIVVGGTIVQGGSLTLNGGTLDNVVFDGVMTLGGSDDVLIVSGGLDIAGPDGQPGTLVVTGTLNSIQLDTPVIGPNGRTGIGTYETLSNLVIEGSGSLFAITGPAVGTLSIASNVLGEESGPIGFAAQTIVNAGTFVETAGAGVGFLADDFINTGAITIEPGALFGLASADPAMTISNLGNIVIASGASLVIGGSLTPGMLEALVGSLVGATPDVLVAYGVEGELLNAGTLFEITPTGSMSDVVFAQASVDGGTIVNAGTLGFAATNQFDGVTFVGPISLTPPSTSLEFEGATTIASLTAAPDLIAVTGSLDSLEFAPGGTLSHSTLVTTPVASQEIDNALIELGLPGTLFTNNVLLVEGGTVTLGATTTLATGTDATIEIEPGASGSSTLVNAGSIVAVGGLSEFAQSETSSISIGHVHISAGNAAFINQGSISAVAGPADQFPGDAVLTVEGTFFNAGTITVTGTHAFSVESGNFYNTGLVQLFTGASIDFQATPTQAGNIYLEDGAETVAFSGTGSFAATLANYTAGDTIDLGALPFGGTLAVTETYAANVLTIFEGTTVAAAIGLPSYAYDPAGFAIGADDAATGTAITTTQVMSSVPPPPPPPPPPPCFLAGTRIRTPAGEIAVEDLAVGTPIVTASGELRPVTWIGHRQVDCVRHPQPELVLPVRVLAGAFGEGLPLRDLVLSPDHSLHVDGVLIPVRHLLNGASVLRDQVAAAHYFHVELATHDVLYAEGLPAESYLDTGNRCSFANGGAAMALHPDFAARAWAGACAPLCQSGPRLVAVRARLLDRVRALGYRPGRAAAPLLLAGGRMVRPATVVGELHRFLLPANTPHVTIVSPTCVPAARKAWSQDRRQLGIAVGGIVAHGRPVDLDSKNLVSGFYATELRDGTRRRWTDGYATLDLPSHARPGALDIRVVEMMRGWELAQPEKLKKNS